MAITKDDLKVGRVVHMEHSREARRIDHVTDDRLWYTLIGTGWCDAYSSTIVSFLRDMNAAGCTVTTPGYVSPPTPNPSALGALYEALNGLLAVCVLQGSDSMATTIAMNAARSAIALAENRK